MRGERERQTFDQKGASPLLKHTLVHAQQRGLFSLSHGTTSTSSACHEYKLSCTQVELAGGGVLCSKPVHQVVVHPRREHRRRKPQDKMTCFHDLILFNHTVCRVCCAVNSCACHQSLPSQWGPKLRVFMAVHHRYFVHTRAMIHPRCPWPLSF